ncbi:glycosyltransferase family 4 protein [Arthrobacter sp. E918]|uniref:Glycosyltransferase family 4 protein n=1 Tax=Arthrobacter mobilis TaxID=2724944 RepID=A0A7X6HCT3_9MICC|nr:glycosyltransferase family 4 protein [Arthrobacter mobilis]
MLILSLSPLRSDPRVLKQIDLFRRRYRVATCGFGPAPDGVADHIELDRAMPSWPRDPRRLLLRRYVDVYWGIAAVAEARRQLRGRDFDAVLANDANTLPLALSLAPARGVHADLHEFAPKEHFNKPAWRALVAPYVRWLCRTYLPQAASVTTVSEGIAEQYRKDFGVAAGVVTNAAPYADKEPRPTQLPIRLIYSSAGQRYRKIENIMEAMRTAPGHVELDLIVMPNEPAYVAELEELGRSLPRVRFRDPVPYTKLVDTVAEYDVSVSVIPPTNFNLAHALPNKFFEAVQARTGLVIGPSPAMHALLERHDLGAVTRDFSAEALREVLDSLTPESVDAWKRNAHQAARELSSEHQNLGWESAIAALLDGR